LGHRQVVPEVQIVREAFAQGIKGGQRSVEVAFKTLDQADLVPGIDVLGILGQHSLQSLPCVGVSTVAPELKAQLICLLDVHRHKVIRR
jgi:hypothetical protein